MKGKKISKIMSKVFQEENKAERFTENPRGSRKEEEIFIKQAARERRTYPWPKKRSFILRHPTLIKILFFVINCTAIE